MWSFWCNAGENGTLVSYSIDPEIEVHLFKRTDMIGPGETITNCMNERLTYLYFEYNSSEEMNEDIQTYNDRISMIIK